MDVLILTDNSIEKVGGTSAYAKQIRDYFDDGADVSIVSIAGENSDIGFSTEMPRLYMQRLFAPKKREKLESKINKFNPDIIHDTTSQYASLPIMKAIRNSGKPAIKTFHGYKYFCMCKSGVHGNKECSGRPRSCLIDGGISLKNYVFRKPIHSLRTKRLKHTYEVALCPAKDLKEISNRFLETKLLPNFVDTDKYSPGGNSKFEGILYFGRVVDSKGIDILLSAYSRMDQDEELNIVGKGQISKFERLADDLGISEDVNFLGYLDEDELIKRIRESKVAVVPSKWRETFGIVGIEAMACGTPVIGSKTGGLKDYIEDGKNGYLFKIKSPVDLSLRLDSIVNEEDYDDFRSNARQTSQKYSKKKQLKTLKEIYFDISE